METLIIVALALWVGYAVVALLMRPPGNDEPERPRRPTPSLNPEPAPAPEPEPVVLMSWDADGSTTIGSGPDAIRMNAAHPDVDTGDPRRDPIKVALDIATRQVEEATVERFTDAITVLVRAGVECPSAPKSARATAALVEALTDADEETTRETLRGVPEGAWDAVFALSAERFPEVVFEAALPWRRATRARGSPPVT